MASSVKVKEEVNAKWSDWDIELRDMSCPFKHMKFTLVYQGSLRSSGNSSKPNDVREIREKLSEQLEFLWSNNKSLEALKVDAYKDPRLDSSDSGWASIPRIAVNGVDPSPEFQCLIDPITVDNREYLPLVRKSLDLACEINVQFLRQEEPGNVMTQGGDMDGRIKTLFDALQMPTPGHKSIDNNASDRLYCLMENDSLVKDFSVSSERLLFPETKSDSEVFLVVEVQLIVLRVRQTNACLL